jgi:hypothetical protein
MALERLFFIGIFFANSHGIVGGAPGARRARVAARNHHRTSPGALAIGFSKLLILT